MTHGPKGVGRRRLVIYKQVHAIRLVKYAHLRPLSADLKTILRWMRLGGNINKQTRVIRGWQLPNGANRSTWKQWLMCYELRTGEGTVNIAIFRAMGRITRRNSAWRKLFLLRLKRFSTVISIPNPVQNSNSTEYWLCNDSSRIKANATSRWWGWRVFLWPFIPWKNSQCIAWL